MDRSSETAGGPESSGLREPSCEGCECPCSCEPKSGNAVTNLPNIKLETQARVSQWRVLLELDEVLTRVRVNTSLFLEDRQVLVLRTE